MTTICGGGSLAFRTVEDRADEYGDCCLGAAMRGVDECTCWRPIYDVVQLPLADPNAPVVTRPKSCIDCAYHRESPERRRGEDVDELPNFWCHQGMRRILAWRHPDGRERPEPQELGAYDPGYGVVQGERVPLRADGTPADRCGGWAQVQRLAAS